MKHKLFSLAILAIASILSCGAVAQNYDFSASVPSGQTLYFRISKGKAVVVNPTGGDDSTAWDGYTKPSGALAIPSTVTNGSDLYPVAAIDDYAFYSCGGITELTIPDTQSIGQSAFASCEGLSSLNLGSVREIAPFAFQNCDGLTSVTFPRTFVMTGVGLFAECDNLVSITVEAGNPAFDSRENCNAVINSNTNILLYGCKTSTFPSSITGIWMYAFEGIPITSAVIPNRVQSIDAYAFSYCSQLSSLTLGSSLRSIGEGAFAYCRALTGTLAIPDSVSSVGDGAFYQCSGLTGAVVFPDSVQYIGTQSFAGCSGITSVTIGNSSTQIGHYAFAECTALASLNMGAVYQIGVFAFRGCTGLTAVTLPRTFVLTGAGLFADCVNLASIVVEAGNPAFDSRDNCNALVNSNTNIMLCGCKNSTFPPTVTGVWAYCFYGQPITSVVMPESMEYIDDYAFYGCDQMTTLVIGDSIRTIGELAFAYCSHLTDTLVIPDTVTSLGQAAFAYCGGLRALRLGKNVATIGEYAFAFDANIASIESKAAVPPTIAGPNTFYNVAGTTPVTVPCPSVAAYRAASGWNQFSNIQGFSDYLDTTVTACDSFSYSGISFTASTDTAVVLANVGGCDSIVTLHLTVKSLYGQCYDTVTVTACDSYTWHGRTFHESVTANDTIINQIGGDSIVTLNLTINYNTTGTDVQTACKSYEWHGTTYTASTDSATYTTTNAAGCDSVVTLNLTLDFDTNSGIDSTVCGQLLWHDSLYTVTGTYLNIDTTATGCINTDTLHLTVYYDSSTAYSVTDTDSYTWVNHGDTATYTQSGTYTNDYTTTDGCASADTLHLTLISTVNYYTVQVHSGNARAGYATIDDSNRVAEGQRCTVRAHAYNGYRFVRWNNGATANPYSFTVTRDTVFVAIFEGTTCTLTVVNGNPGRGTVTGSCTAPYGSRRNISAVPAAGCRFSHWSDGDTNASRSVTVNGNMTLTAYFDAQLFHVAALSADTTQGTVSGGGDYAYIDKATLQATPATGYRFDRWNDGDTANPRRITVMCDSTFTAYFSELRYRIDVVSNDTVQGSVSGGGSYRHMDYVTITATPNSGYLFDRWNDGDTTNPRRIQVTSDSTFTAYFWRGLPRYTLVVLSTNSRMGTVSGGGLYEEGTAVTITATPNSGYEFVQWNDGVTANPRTVTVNSDTAFTAMFHDVNVPVTFTVSVTSNDRQMGSASGGGTYQAGTRIQLNAYPAPRCRFVRWSDGTTTASYSMVVNRNISLTAIFARESFTITAIPYDTTQGTVTGGGTYAAGTTVTLTATPYDGYRFVRWSTAETANPLNVTVTGDRVYVALFELLSVGIEAAETASVRVWGSDRTIHIEGLKGEPLRVYDVTGRKMAEQSNATGSLTIPMAYPGLYMVQTGGTTHKVLIR